MVRRSLLLALLALVGGVLAGCGDSAPAAGGPRPTRVAGHYAELWGDGARTVLLLPHGGWAADGPAGVQKLRPVARRFVAMGWRALTLSYAPGRAGLATVAAGWRTASRGGRACVYGESSGAHWALVLAARDRGVRCVVAAAAPTDLVTWPGQIRSRGARQVAVRLRAAAFGRRRGVLERYSPALRWPRGDCAQVLLLTARNDPIIPLAQARELRRRATHSTLVRLRAGTSAWVHSRVRADDLEASWEAVRRVLDAPAGAC
jgi:acetyl esterase/lipase